MASECPSTQTRSRLSGLDSASMCESGVLCRELFSVSDLCRYNDEIQELIDEITLLGDRDHFEDGECDDDGDGGEYNCDGEDRATTAGGVSLQLRRSASGVTVRTWDSHQLAHATSATNSSSAIVGPDNDGIVIQAGDVASVGTTSEPIQQPHGPAWRLLLSPLALGQLFFMVLCVGILICISISGDKPYISPLTLPHVGYTRLAVFSAVLCLLSAVIMVFVHVTRLDHALLIDWSLLHVCLFSGLAMCLVVSSSLSLYQLSIYNSHQFHWITHWTKCCLLTASIIGFCAAACSLLIGWLPCACAGVGQSAAPVAKPPANSDADRSAPTGHDWNYSHPQPDSTAPEPSDSQRFLINSPYIEWHVQNGCYHLLSEEIRRQLPAPV